MCISATTRPSRWEVGANFAHFLNPGNNGSPFGLPHATSPVNSSYSPSPSTKDAGKDRDPSTPPASPPNSVATSNGWHQQSPAISTTTSKLEQIAFKQEVEAHDDENTSSSTSFSNDDSSYYTTNQTESLKCSVCDWTAVDFEELRLHMQNEHEEGPGSDGEGDSKSSRINSQGKLKKFRCKQCTFIATTKHDFWVHTRDHIKPDRMLKCPHCAFVTEFKHHLEYHLRNHNGTKPFQCDKCSYRCVNKSMLNSHLKSHSDVYQYRCADCNYAVKYCHSLKLHLRKYNHRPDIVLNPDGTPNPFPIIDVYGTRRGPKQKKDELDSPPPTTTVTNPTITTSTSAPTPPATVSTSSARTPTPPPAPFPYPPIMPFSLFNIFEKPVDLTVTPSLPPLSPPPPPPPPPAPVVTEVAAPVAPVVSLAPVAAAASSRRKGKAYKLDRAILERQHSSNSDDESGPTPPKVPSPQPKIFECNYCDIQFKDPIMHTMHMGYHGFNDPFTCNMCGQQTSDKISFFLHIGRDSHH